MATSKRRSSTDTRSYHLWLRGSVDENEINASSPVEIAVVTVNAVGTQIIVFTDQPGLIGLLRHIHSRGLTLLSVIREPDGSGE